MPRSAQAEVWQPLPEYGVPQPPANVPGFDAIYEAWFDEVARWARALGGPAADLDDLVQDVFVIVHRRLPHFDGQNVAGWLYQITRRRVRDFRRLFWVRHLFGKNDPHSEPVAAASAEPLALLEAKRRTEQLDRLLVTLSTEQRAAFVLFEIEGYSGEEIARIQNVPINTVWARIHKARKKLQGKLARDELRSQRGLS